MNLLKCFTEMLISITKLTFIFSVKGAGDLNNDRRDRIHELLETRPYISLAELEKMFPDVSAMTLRRDIIYFEENHELIRVRGGARSMKFITSGIDESVEARMNENVLSKELIAKKAAEFLEPECSIFLDSGSTMHTFVKHVPNERYTFTTTDPAAALDICRIGLPSVYIVGGKLNGDNKTVVGLQATRFLQDINIDIAFLSPAGLSSRSGFTVANYSECELKKMAVEKARLVVILMDESKIDKSLPYTFATFEDADILITSSPLPAEMKKLAKEKGVRIIDVSKEN